MPTLTLYHNPRCSKSREALALLESRGVEVIEHLYLNDPLTREQLEGLAGRLGDDADRMLRRDEPEWKARGIGEPTRTQIIDAIVEHPRLLQRPIADDGEYAVIGRPPQAVLQLI
ncbi:arsenate reductase family protein [Salinicola sp. LHM]|jgi:arsenate reductase|uniref:arsenate reductase family protein n=1 Tax=Salinicola TaxID=404432 RepID=UPI0008DCFA8B|nr:MULTISPECIES: arsenate reductase family protein [Salinicola]MEC8918907.1 arsenate reductase family protein [Pseudomonadota bacterium]MDF3917454.1 arsenate reductase family protein [Salinicola salarius]MED5501716.1 arsenate reductase family protein [Pseudomonadota bacterium]OHZ02566.1 arsenate reductase (glutaredoxin) [Salinicola sp. MIT1003]WQH31429.1 arsenate reductase family protein [Salinicola sp. LHM]